MACSAVRGSALPSGCYLIRIIAALLPDSFIEESDMNSGPVIVGLLAHVDAGKTTLAESLLFCSGAIRKQGRVDHQNAFLDTFDLEKRRGITIFSKQAQMFLSGQTSGGRSPEGKLITLLDTPGHADFSAEMERVLQVLDYALLVISGPDGVQGQVRVLWRLLAQYRIPTILFINKMDQPGTDAGEVLSRLKAQLDENCVSFCPGSGDDFEEELAACDEDLLERYLETGRISDEDICSLIRERKVFPCFFGSALKLSGIDTLLSGLEHFLKRPSYGGQFGARVFKIAREGNTRLTYLKVTGGSLKVKQLLGEEKVDQIRLPSGSSSKLLQEAPAGYVCAVAGPDRTFAGQGFGTETDRVLAPPVLEPVLTYTLELPEGTDVQAAWQKLRQLEEEIPELHLVWEEEGALIQAHVMGEVQIEILREMIRDRFNLEVEFGSGRILYKETIRNKVEGVGHFEPLRHYAEVHLVLEPAPAGSGVILDNVCRTDDLDLNWQRLILTHLAEKRHRGVLTGSELTDVKITLTAGRAHLKHTEGGDFRQATYRAVRQGLMQADSVLLEPMYSFRLEVPQSQSGRAMSDIQAMSGTFEGPYIEDGFSVLTGTAPVACMQNYMNSVRAYTAGSGRLTLTPTGYAPCHNAQEVIGEISYDPDADTSNPSGSVFCSHGAGFHVPWNEVPRRMHLPGTYL